MNNNNNIIEGFDDLKDESLSLKLQKVTDINGCILIKVSGHLDTYNSNTFRQQLELVASKFIYIILDLSRVSYMSSTGVGAIVATLKKVKEKEGNIILMSIPDNVYDVFQLLGFSLFLTRVNSLKEAVSIINNAQPQIIFPIKVQCKSCSKKFKISKPGTYRCSDCKTVFLVDEKGTSR